VRVLELVETLQHLGPLHPAERALTLVLAFGPFVLLALTLWITRRRRSDLEQGEDVRQDNEGNGP
jgi:hypothetical protein